MSSLKETLLTMTRKFGDLIRRRVTIENVSYEHLLQIIEEFSGRRFDIVVIPKYLKTCFDYTGGRTMAAIKQGWVVLLPGGGIRFSTFELGIRWEENSRILIGERVDEESWEKIGMIVAVKPRPRRPWGKDNCGYCGQCETIDVLSDNGLCSVCASPLPTTVQLFWGEEGHDCDGDWVDISISDERNGTVIEAHYCHDSKHEHRTFFRNGDKVTIPNDFPGSWARGQEPLPVPVGARYRKTMLPPQRLMRQI